MSCPVANYNEWSWAIDLIGHLKQLATRDNCSIKDAGGEQTVKADGGSLFPDVLLFGDRATARILQGWELKMPDTGIDNADFRENAEKKRAYLDLIASCFGMSRMRTFTFAIMTLTSSSVPKLGTSSRTSKLVRVLSEKE